MRYAAYLTILNMLANVIIFVPTVLIRERYHGAVASLLVGAGLGTLCMFLMIHALSTCRRQGLSDLLGLFPPAVKSSILYFFGLVWLTAGANTLLGFNNIIIRFINPDVQGIHMIFIFAIFIAVVLYFLSSSQILYLLEILLLLNIPLVLVILYQALTHEYLSFDAMLEIATHVTEMPSWSALSAASFVFTGYANLIVFNRIFSKPVTVRQTWFLPFLLLGNLFVTFFIPIGMYGTDGVADLQFPWVMTADALRIELGPIERLTTIFLLLYVSISVMSVIVHWHVALQLWSDTGMLQRLKQRAKRPGRITIILLTAIVILMLWLETSLRENEILFYAELWLNVRLPLEVALVALTIWLARRNQHAMPQ